MRRSLIAALLTLSAIFAAPAFTAAEDDTVKKNLDAAKSAYEEAVQKYQKAVDDYFEKREEFARKNGDKKLLDANKEDIKRFEDAGELPATAPAALKQRYSAARLAMEKAYGAAIKEYTKSKKDEEAAAIDKQLEEFKKTQLGLNWIQLFNGKNLEGWTPDVTATKQSDWKVFNGLLQSGSPSTTLVCDRADLGDFRLRVEAMIKDGGKCEIGLRRQRTGTVHRMFKVNVNSTFTANDGSYHGAGCIARWDSDRKPAFVWLTEVNKTNSPPPGKWFIIEVIAQGKDITVLVNGKKQVEYTDTDKHPILQGALVLSPPMPKGESLVKFRKIELAIIRNDKK